MIARAPWELPVDEPEPPRASVAGESRESKPAPSLAERLKQKWNEWFR
jgi:hypothetical protein